MQAITLDEYLEQEGLGKAPNTTDFKERESRYNTGLDMLSKYYPIKYSLVIKVEYDAKSDRYTGVFYENETRSDKLKLSAEVAQFLVEHKNGRGPNMESIIYSPYLKMDNGQVSDVFLLKIR